MKSGWFILFFIVLACSTACEDRKKNFPIRYYAGAVLITQNLITSYSDSGKKKMVILAPLQAEFTNGDQEYQKGMEVQFFKTSDTVQSRLVADLVHYNKQQDLYTAVGHVVLEDLVKRERMSTSKLHWSRIEGRVFTNEFVEITTPKQILKGKGLTARQDFSSYTILKPEGQIFDADSVDFF